MNNLFNVNKNKDYIILYYLSIIKNQNKKMLYKIFFHYNTLNPTKIGIEIMELITWSNEIDLDDIETFKNKSKSLIMKDYYDEYVFYYKSRK